MKKEKEKGMDKKCILEIKTFTYAEFQCYLDIPIGEDWNMPMSVPTKQTFRPGLWAAWKYTKQT